jgi:hypothetical protein
MLMGTALSESSDRYPYSFFDDLRLRNPSELVLSHENSVYQVTVNVNANATTSNATETTDTFRLVEIKSFLPFSNGGVSLRPGATDEAFTALLAMHHWNQNQNQKVNDRSTISPCNVRMTMELLDTQLSPIVATRTFTSLLQTESISSFRDPPVTAVVGAQRSSVTAPLAILTGVNNVPQFSYASTSLNLNVKEQYPIFGRTVTSSIGEAAVALQYFQSIQSSHVAILFLSDAYGSALKKVFSEQAAAATNPIETVSFAISVDASPAEALLVLQQLQASSIRHIYAIIYESELSMVATAADEFNMLSSDYLWLYPGFDLDVVMRQETHYTVGSPVYKAVDCAAIITMQGGITTNTLYSHSQASDNDNDDRSDQALELELGLDFLDPDSGYAKFVDSWQDAYGDVNFTDYVRSKLPRSLETTMEGFNRSALEFSKVPGSFRPFLYDTITAVGISMCRARNITDGDDRNGNNGASSSSDFMFSGPDVYEQFRYLDMPGASGRVRINETTGTRDYETMSFVIWNVRALPQVDNDNEGNGRLAFVPSLQYQGSGWSPIADNKFLYKGGSEYAPDSLPPATTDNHYIGKTTQTLGYVVMCITLCSCVVSLVWLILNRSARVVTSAQPMFLLVISLGAAVMSLTILPLSMDETSVDNVARLDATCMLVPWFYFIGVNLITGALLAKVMALNTAYVNPELESINVSPWMILRTCLSLVLLNSLVLLLWTLMSPMEWVREETSARDLYSRSTGSFGYCESSNDVPFIVALSVLNAGAVILASLGAFRSRHIETEFGDSRYVSICLAVILHAWCLCVPIALVVNDNPEGIFWIATATVFVAAQAVLMLVYVPKMLALKTQHKQEPLRKSSAHYDSKEPESAPTPSDDFMSALAKADEIDRLKLTRMIHKKEVRPTSSTT